MRPWVGISVAIAALAPPQQEAELDLILDRLGTYLANYEESVGEIVADELYYQREAGRSISVAGQLIERKLESEVAFLRLPGGAEWFGIRDVRKVDGKPVNGTGERLADLLKRSGDDLFARASAIVEASSRYNLGGARTINTPTVPLEALSARNHPRFIFKLRGADRVSGVHTRRLDFEEFDEPTMVLASDGGNLWSHGSAWVETETGRLWRAELIVGPDPPRSFRRVALESRVKVEFALDSGLKLLVPKRLEEMFWLPRGRGEGVATYSNYRRLGSWSK